MAKSKCDTLLDVPAFDYGVQPRESHSARVIARGAAGKGSTCKVERSHMAKIWWLSCSQGSYRATNTLRTRSPEKAERWRQAVESGCVRVVEGKPREMVFARNLRKFGSGTMFHKQR